MRRDGRAGGEGAGATAVPVVDGVAAAVTVAQSGAVGAVDLEGPHVRAAAAEANDRMAAPLTPLRPDLALDRYSTLVGGLIEPAEQLD